MNIVKGCIIDCELLLEGTTLYVPVIIKVEDDEYLRGPKGNIFHNFDVTILELPSTSRYNKYFPIGETISVRAGDLYNGTIIEYPEDYAALCKEKADRKQMLTNQPHAGSNGE